MLSFLSGNPVYDPVTESDVHVNKFRDPFIIGLETGLQAEAFQKTANLVLFTDATYIVLCPGTQEALLAIARTAGTTWKDARFVRDSGDLPIVRRLAVAHNMVLDRGQAVPAILEFEGTNNIIGYGRA